MKKFLIAAFAALALAFAAFGPAAAAATKVDVCHATGSATNPYVLITVNINSVGAANDLKGHAGHANDSWEGFWYDGVFYPGQGDMSNCITPEATPTDSDPDVTPTDPGTEVTATPGTEVTATAEPGLSLCMYELQERAKGKDPSAFVEKRLAVDPEVAKQYRNSICYQPQAGGGIQPGILIPVGLIALLGLGLTVLARRRQVS
jgi:hypothetical protein